MTRAVNSLLLAAAVSLLVGAPVRADEALPRPAGLEPNVQFWTRIYTEVESNSGLIHDARRLDVVYEVIRFPEGLSPRSRERNVEQAKRHYASILRSLARGKRTGLSDEEARVLGRWPSGVTNATLEAAVRNLRFQLGQADRFRAGLARSGVWRDLIEQALGASGVPLELAALPHVESSYNPSAYSRVGAAGLWQFTRSTGRLFMRIDDVVDERLDARKASIAAAKLLRNNHERLGTWPLAITAYNHGVAGMARAVRKLGTSDIVTISQHYDGRTFGFASRNFYAEFLAALEVDRNAESYFGPIPPDPPHASESVVLDHFYTPATLERAFGVGRDSLRAFNPDLRPAVWNGNKLVPRGYELDLPPGSLQQPAAEILAAIPPGERKAEQHRDRFYEVRRGDSLSKIARQFGVREGDLVMANNLRSRHRIRAGQVLVLPDDAVGGSTRVARASVPSDGVYRVRRGDNLSIIAARFGVSENALVEENSLRNRNQIAVGQRLRIPGAAPAVVAAAVAPTPPATSALATRPPAPAPAPAPAREAEAPLATAETPASEPAPDGEERVLEDDASTPDAEVLAVDDEEPAPDAEVLAVVGEELVLDGEVLALDDEEPLLDGEVLAVVGEEPVLDGEALTLDGEELVLDGEVLTLDGEELVLDGEVLAVVGEEPLLDGAALASDGEAEAAEPVATAALPANVPRPDPSDYAIGADDRITVQADETLGHYAEWLEIKTSRLRHLNGMKYDAPVVIGRKAKLDFSRVTPETFERRRLAYHHSLQEEYFSAFEVTGTRTHTLRPGESLWYLSERKYQVPIWLIRQFNPDVDLGSLHAGMRLVIPEVEGRTG